MRGFYLRSKGLGVILVILIAFSSSIYSYYYKISHVIASNAPITVMPHPPRLVVGGDFEEGLTQQRALCEGHLPYILFFYCTFAHVCNTDLTKETTEGN